MTWEHVAALRTKVDAFVELLAMQRKAGAPYDTITTTLDSLDAARIAWEAAYEAADEAEI